MKKYFVSFSSVASSIRLKKSLSHENFTLFSHFSKSLSDNCIQTLIICVSADNEDEAYVKANQEKNKIIAYLAGIFQVPFFFTDHSIDYEVYDSSPVPEWETYKLPSVIPVSEGWPRSFGIIFSERETVVIDKIPDLSQYRECEEIFYMWRSATDPFNELGWRFLNYFRIFEKITNKQRGGKQKSKEMWQAFSQAAKMIITENDFVVLANKWGNPSAHGHMPNSVIPITPHGQYNEHPDATKLFMLGRILIKGVLDKSPCVGLVIKSKHDT